MNEKWVHVIVFFPGGPDLHLKLQEDSLILERFGGITKPGAILVLEDDEHAWWVSRWG